MHCHRQFSCYGNGGSFEAYPLPEFEAPVRRLLSAELRVRMTVAAS